MKRFFLCFLFVANTCFVFSQQENTKLFIEETLDKSFDFIDRRELDSASFFLEKADIGMANFPKDSSLYFKRKLAGGALIMRKGDTEEALSVFLTCLTYFKKQKDKANLGLTLYQMAICNYYLNRRPYAIRYFKEAEAYRNLLPKKIQTKILQNLGTMNLEEGQAQKDTVLWYRAIENFEKASQIFIQENWIDELSLCESLHAETYIQLGQLNKALEIINRAVDHAKQVDNKNYIGFALIKKNSILNKQKKYNEALETVNEAVRLYQRLDDDTTLSYAYQQKKETLDALQRFEDASRVSDSIYSLTVTIYNERLANGVTEMEAKYKTAEQEREIAEQKLAIKNKNIFALILGASILILGIIIVGLYKRHQFKQKQFQKEMDLKDALAKIKTQNRLQEQRLEISRDLHDNIGSQLTFIISSVDNLKRLSSDASKLVKEKLTSISGFTAETIDQLRDTIWAMNKNEVHFEDLYGRLLSYIEKAKTISSATTFHIEEKNMTNITFSSIVGMNLFRVIQESINNAIKHANASEIRVLFEKIDDKITVVIQDNGVGFDQSNFIAGNGLSNIEARISSIEGKVFISSEQNQGTSVSIELNQSTI